MIEPLLTVEAVRRCASDFCSQRNWEKFHLPTSLVLALTGESGELSEIFQWKGDLEEYLTFHKHEQSLPFSSKEVVHIGEEIADVFIYSTRLADVCNIDLSNAMTMLAEQPNRFVARRVQYTEPWTSFNFKATDMYIFNIDSWRSHRHVALEIQTQVGKVTAIFAKYSESKTTKGLPGWSENDVNGIAHALASICSLLIVMAKLTHLSIGHVIADKFAKNSAKYPVSLSKNSSAKYTKYIQASILREQPSMAILLPAFTVGILSYYMGRYWK